MYSLNITTISEQKKIRALPRLLLMLIVTMSIIAPAQAHGSWRQASRESANLAPTPEAEKQAVIQVYAAPVWGWRGLFADHTWISVKPENADSYTVYEVIGWRLRRGGSAVRIARDIPDRHWFGKKPRLLLDLRGDDATRLIPLISEAVASYPYPNRYRAFPGPNSNTFTAWIARNVPALNLKLPLRAIGKSYTALFASP